MDRTAVAPFLLQKGDIRMALDSPSLQQQSDAELLSQQTEDTHAPEDDYIEGQQPGVRDESGEPDDDSQPSEQPDAPGELAERPDDSSAEADEFDEYVLREAEAYGFGEEDARSFGSRESLERALAAIDRNMAAFQRQMAQQQPQTNQQTGYQPQPATEQPAQQQLELNKYELPQGEVEWEDGVVDVLNGMAGHSYEQAIQLRDQLDARSEAMKTEIAQLKQSLGAIQAHYQQEQEKRTEQEMDSFFDSISEEYGDTFGKGSIHSLSETSPQRRNRQALVNEMVTIAGLEAQQGRQSSIDSLGRRALRVSDKFGARQSAKPTSNGRSSRRQGLARPIQRTGSNRSNTDRAADYAERRLRELGAEQPDSITRTPTEV